jgi:hypothetical protein
MIIKKEVADAQTSRGDTGKEKERKGPAHPGDSLGSQKGLLFKRLPENHYG